MGHIIMVWGYWALAGFVLAESFGVPLPGEAALIVAGTYAGHAHHLSAWLIFVVAAAAAAVGSQVGYLLGRRGGYRLLRRWGPKVGLDERRLGASRYLFDTYGARVVFFGRFVSVLRTYSAFLAGTNNMSRSRFALANVAGAIVWAATYTYLSDRAGNTLQRASGLLTWVLLGAAAAVLFAVLLLWRRRLGEFAARAHRAYCAGAN